jgi:2,3-bisphosphoglycerate-independent phosphoglycerate mutase
VGREVVDRIEAELRPIPGVEVFVRHVKEHRAVVVLRGEGLEEGVDDTDPQKTGVPALRAQAMRPEAQRTADVLQAFLEQAREILTGSEPVGGMLARGVASYQAPPSFRERFGLRAAAVARYPMYRGVARLVGMEIPGVPSSDEETMELMERVAGEYDFTFVHYKATDARGEDGDFDAKVAAIEAADAQVERILSTGPDVLAVTGDHSTPAGMASHSWHPVPLLLHGPHVRPTASSFGEDTCRLGDIGVIPSRYLMSLALAQAGRLEKFGA